MHRSFRMSEEVLTAGCELVLRVHYVRQKHGVQTAVLYTALKQSKWVEKMDSLTGVMLQNNWNALKKKHGSG
jgi:hypothetical protein